MSDVPTLLDEEVGVLRRSDWLLVDQNMINRFADATLDHQFIHVDPLRAAASPFGGTVAHGFLTLSLLTRLAEMTPLRTVPGIRMGINYGLDRVRFLNPVRSGSRVRAALTLSAVDEKRPGQLQQTYDVVVEIEHADKPALIATWLALLFI